MTAIASRSLAIGLVAGLFLAIAWQHYVPQVPLPVYNRSKQATDPLPFSDSMAQLLKSGLQAARQRVWSGGGGGYKSAHLAATSSFLHPSSPSILFSPPISGASTTASRPLSTTSAMSAQKPFFEAIKERRTYYQLNKEAPISDKQIKEITEKAILHVPSSFNSQSTRLVVLLNKDHDQFWDYVLEVLKPLTPQEQFPKTEQKIGGFKAAYGTILFYEDPEPVEGLRKAFPLYAHHFGDWSEHTNAMHQYALWVALEAEGLGANLQHYNPIIDQKAAEHWNIPLAWKLRSQLVFGGRAGEPGEKKFEPVEGKRLFIHGAKE